MCVREVEGCVLLDWVVVSVKLKSAILPVDIACESVVEEDK